MCTAPSPTELFTSLHFTEHSTSHTLPRRRGAARQASSGDSRAIAEGTAGVPWRPVSGSHLSSLLASRPWKPSSIPAGGPRGATDYPANHPRPRAEEAARARVEHPAPRVFKAQMAPKGLSDPSAACCPHLLLFSRSVVSDSLRCHGLQHASLPCPSPTPGACSNTSITLVMSSNHLILCHPLLPPLVFPSIRVFSNELALCVRWQSTGASASASVPPMNIPICRMGPTLGPRSPGHTLPRMPRGRIEAHSQGSTQPGWTPAVDTVTPVTLQWTHIRLLMALGCLGLVT